MTIPERAMSILEFIGSYEAPEGYDQIYGGVRKHDHPPKPLTQMTVAEVLAWQDSIDKSYPSEAAGRYQVMEDTLRGLVKRGRVDPSAVYNKETQDAIGFELMKRRGWDKFTSGEISEIDFGNRLAAEWAAMPVLSGPKAGKSLYAGDGLNSALTTPEVFLAALGSNEGDGHDTRRGGEGFDSDLPRAEGITGALFDYPPTSADTPPTAPVEPDPIHPGFRSPLPQPQVAGPQSFLADVADTWMDTGIVRKIDNGLFGAPVPPPDPAFVFSEANGYRGMEQHWRVLQHAQSQGEFDQMVAKIHQETAMRARIAAGGRFIAPMLGEIASPEGIASMMLIPGASGIGFLRSSTRIGLATATLETGAELARQDESMLATTGEGVLRVGGATLFAGGLAGVFGTLGKRRVNQMVRSMSDDVAAMEGIAKPTTKVGGRNVRWNAQPDEIDDILANAGPVKADAVRVTLSGDIEVDATRIMREYEQGVYRDFGLDDVEVPDAMHWAEFRIRLAQAKHEDGIPFGNSGFEIPDHLTIRDTRYDIVQESRQGRPAAVLDHQSKTLRIDPDEMNRLFQERAWAKPRELPDGTKAEPLPSDAFGTLERWVNFVLAHEIAHGLVRRRAGETMGAFETRVNRYAWHGGMRYTRPTAKIEEPAATGVGGDGGRSGEPPSSGGRGPDGPEPPEPPDPPVQRAMRDWRKWSDGNKRELKNHFAKAMDRLVDGPYKRVHRKAKHGLARNIMDVLAIDGGLQTLAHRAGQTPGASIDTLGKQWMHKVQLLLDGETKAYESYLGHIGRPKLTDVPLRKSVASLTPDRFRKRADGSKAMSLDEFRTRTARAYITGKQDAEPTINAYASDLRKFYEAFAEQAREVGVFGNLTPKAAARNFKRIKQQIGIEPRPGKPGIGGKGGLEPVEPTGFHKFVQDLFFRTDRELIYELYVKVLEKWRDRTARFFEAYEANYERLVAVFDELGLEAPSPFSDALGTPRVRQALRDLDEIAKVDLDELANPVEPKPQPPFDMKRFEDRMMSDLVSKMNRRLNEMRAASVRKGSAAEVIEEDYFTRIFKRDIIEKHRDEFRRIVRQAMLDRGRSEASLDKWVDDFIDDLLTTPDAALPGRARDTIPSVMRRRGLDLPNSLFVGKQIKGELVDFIETDPMMVASNYAQRMGPYIEFGRRFGDDGFGDPHLGFEKAMMLAMRSEREAFGQAKNFGRHWKPIERDLLLMKDRVLHAVVENPARWDNRMASVLKDWATLVFMGKASISTLPDIAKIQMVHGVDEVSRFAMARMDRELAPLIHNLQHEARVAGALTDVALGGLIKKFAEVGTDPVFLSRPERWLRATTNRYFILNGLGPITYAMRNYAGAISAHRFMDDAVKWTSGKGTDDAIGRLAQYGIDFDMAKRMKQMVDDGHATLHEQGFWTPNTDAWTDAGAKRAFHGALLQEVDNTVLVASAADKPTVIDGALHFPRGNAKLDELLPKLGAREVGEYWRLQSGIASLPFQFWNYAMAATNKIAVAGLENPDLRLLGGLATMTTLGYIALQLRTPSWAWNKMTTTDKISRIIDQSGFAGVLPELVFMAQNGISGLTGVNPFPFNYRWGRAPSLFEAGLDFAGPGPSVLSNALIGGAGVAVGAPRAAYTLGWAVPFRNHLLVGDSIGQGIGALHQAVR